MGNRPGPALHGGPGAALIHCMADMRQDWQIASMAMSRRLHAPVHCGAARHADILLGALMLTHVGHSLC